MSKQKGIILKNLNNLSLKKKPKGFSPNLKTSSLSKIFERYPIPNPFNQITTKDLQAEVNDLKSQVRLLKTEVLALKTKDLDIEAKVTILDSRKASTSCTPNITLDIRGIPDSDIPES